MNENTQPTLLNRTQLRDRAAGALTIYAVVLLGLAYFAWQNGAWQLIALSGVMALMTLAAGLGVLLIHRNRQQVGIWLIISVPLVMMVTVGWLMANVGLPVAVVGVVSVAFLARQLMPGAQVNRPVAAGFVTAALVIIMDQFDLPARYVASDQSFWAMIVLATIGIIAYLTVVATEHKTYSLRTKLVFGFVIVSVVAVTGVSLFAVDVSRQNLVDNANQRLLSSATQTAASLDDFVEATSKAISVEARLPEFSQALGTAGLRPNASRHVQILFNLSQKDPENILAYALIDSDGLTFYDTSGRPVGESEGDQPYFRVPFESGKVYISPVLFSPQFDEPVIHFSAPIKNPGSEVIGVLRATYRAGILQHLMEESVGGSSEATFATLFDENSLTLANSANPQALYQLASPIDNRQKAQALVAQYRLPNLESAQSSINLPELSAGLANANSQPFFTVRESAGSQNLNQVAAVKMQTRPWQVVFAQPQEVFLAPVREQIRNTMLLAVLVIGLATVIAAVVARQLTRPIIQLTNVAQQITGGDLSLQAPVETQDETGQLAQAFNEMTAQLRTLIGSLEEQVQERTAELVISVEVGQRATAIRDLDELLSNITAFIRDRFELYHVQVFLVDDVKQNLVLRAGTGQELLAGNFSLPINIDTTVGRSVVESRSIVVADTTVGYVDPNQSMSSSWYSALIRREQQKKPASLLPETLSELAIPLMVEGQVLGVLDLQDDRLRSFTEKNLSVYEAIALQLSISMDSARQWTLAQEAQEKLQNAVQQLTRERWTQTLASRKKELAYRYDLSSVSPHPAKTTNGDVSAPLVVQNQPIGRLSVSVPKNKSLSNEEQALVQAVAQQLSLKAEALRLFEETQQHVTREQLARQITDKIRASRDIESALKTAATELGQALGIAKAEINLQVKSANPPRQEDEA